MKLYFAGADNKTAYRLLRKFNVDCLMSYYGLRNKGLSFVEQPIFLDSGAFTAFTKQIKINIDAYIDFIKKNESFITVYANLDVIGDWRATGRNQKYMESKGLKPLPTFHFGSPLVELRELCDRYSYIALGGLVPLARKKKLLERWLDNCFSVIKNKKPKIHGFGVNALWAWKRYPFYSVDATSWLVPSRYGQLTTMEKENVVSYSRNNRNEAGKMIILRENNKLLELQIGEYLKMQRFVNKLWELKK